MKKILTLLIISISTTCLGGYYGPKDGNLISLKLEQKPILYKLTSSDIAWQKKFLKKINFKKFIEKGGTFKTFLLSNHTLYENGKITKEAVFVDNKNKFEVLFYQKRFSVILLC